MIGLASGSSRLAVIRPARPRLTGTSVVGPAGLAATRLGLGWLARVARPTPRWDCSGVALEEAIPPGPTHTREAEMGSTAVKHQYG